MLDFAAMLEEIKASPYEEARHCRPPYRGCDLLPGLNLEAAFTVRREPGRRSPGPLLVTIERERNKKPIYAPMKGEVAALYEERAGQFVEAGTPLLRLRHYLSKEEVVAMILKKALHLFRAPERAKYYFVFRSWIRRSRRPARNRSRRTTAWRCSSCRA